MTMIEKNSLGFYELADKPEVKELAEYYKEKYYQEGKGSYELSYTQSELDYFNSRNSRIHYLVNLY